MVLLSTSGPSPRVLGVALEGDPLGTLTVSSDTNWADGTYDVNDLTVTEGATLTVAGGSFGWNGGTVSDRR